MVRLHHQGSDALDGIDVPHVVDHSDHPDIRDLVLAADVLVTDHASVQFDFAVTGRPVLSFTYDLDHYRGDLRHTYFDFEQITPGPMLGTAVQVLDALGDVGRATDGYRERYDRFRERFCSCEDGHATERVLVLVLPGPVRADEAG